MVSGGGDGRGRALSKDVGAALRASCCGLVCCSLKCLVYSRGSNLRRGIGVGVKGVKGMVTQ